MEKISSTIKGISQRDFVHMESIRDLLFSSNIYYNKPEDYFYLFIDYIQLLFQPTPDTDPIVILFWKGDRCIYSSFSDPYFCSAYHLSPSKLFPPPKGVLISKDLNIWMTLHRIRSKDLETFEDQSLTYIHPKNSQENRVLEPDVSLMEQIDCLLFHDSNHKKQSLMNQFKIIPDFSKNLIKTIENDRQKYSSKLTDKKIDDLDYKNVMLPCLELFRDVVDEVYEEIGCSRDFKFQNQKLPLGNLFCVVQTVQSGKLRFNRYPYTAGLLLSNNQKKNFEVWFEKSHTKTKKCRQVKDDFAKCLDQLEAPLGLNSRAAVDIVFSSGVIDFGRNINDGLWNKIDTKNEQERQCNLVNNCIFPSIEASLEFLPIFINKIPWLSFLTFSPLDKAHRDSRWEKNYYFYRDFVSGIIIPLRIKSKTIYIFKAIEMAFGKSVNWENHPTEISKEINRLWDILARVYPYPRFCIFDRKEYDLEPQKNQDSEATIKIPGSNQEWVFVIKENQYFGAPQGNWGRVKNDFLMNEFIRSMEIRIIDRHQSNLEIAKHREKITDLEIKAIYKIINETGSYYGIIGTSEPMIKLYQQIEKVAPSPTTVLIRGESGTGKEVVANAIHRIYNKGPFIPINCAPLSETFLMSELFGHRKGAFTGAEQDRDGAIRTAKDGTIFLDEIGDLPTNSQAMLLRFLQEKEVKSLGDDRISRENVRIIAATNHDLEEDIKNGKFRSDILYRFPVTLNIPPLKDRKEDIPVLAHYFIKKISKELNNYNIKGITDLGISKLKKYNWPGNLRELENCIHRAVVFCNEIFIDQNDIILSDNFESKEEETLTIQKSKEEMLIDAGIPRKKIERIEETIKTIAKVIRDKGGIADIVYRDINEERKKHSKAVENFIFHNYKYIIIYIQIFKEDYPEVYKLLPHLSKKKFGVLLSDIPNNLKQCDMVYVSSNNEANHEQEKTKTQPRIQSQIVLNGQKE